jgi:ribonuclease BN (tRNA processing enzyme)
LIDTCGGFELPRQLARIGQPIAGLRHVVLTHQHMDHIGGVPALYIASVPLAFYALRETLDGMHTFMQGCFPEFLAQTSAEFPIRPGVREIAVVPGERREIGGYAVSFFAVEHRVPTLAVRVEQGGRVLAFSADGIPTDSMIACACDADLFICDALCALKDGARWAERARSLMHPVAREAAEMAVAARAKALALTHLARYANADNLRAEAQAVFPGPVTVPDDCSILTV